ncbi:MAG: RluA family pseudouridine synthase [Deltaproteobacteria bacterium]|nr:RluA family pseudouridine synthase [Deltaproteobacteria bacterium]
MVYRFNIEAKDHGKRLDIYLQSRLTEMSRTMLRKIIDLGGAHLQGRRVRKCGQSLETGQHLEVHLDQASLIPFRLESAQIIYQDRYLIAINKPAGIETQPTPARYKGTLYEAIQVWLGRDRSFGRKLEIGMAQRLDRDTSGVMVFSIHPQSHKALTDQMHNRLAKKRYLALITGSPDPPEGAFHSYLAKQRKSNRVISVSSGGKEAITRYRIVRNEGGLSLAEIDLETGRMHQIRAHFAEAGYPLLGDKRYGGTQKYGGLTFERQCLHSSILRLTHPVSGEFLQFKAPIPDDMNLDQLRLHS